MDTLTAILAAAVPTAIYSLLLWWLDRYEKEPLPLLIIAFVWGAVPAIALAVLVELVLAIPLERSPIGPDATTWGLAPVVEELFKALALVGLFLWARHEFDGPLDGIVYGALIGFGFSMTENALYFIREQDFSGLFWVRGVLFGLNHAFFTSIVGLAFGAVRYHHGVRLKVWALFGGLTLAILFHALHNLLATGFAAGLFFSWLVQSTGVLVILAVAVLSWRHERRWLEEELGDEVRSGIVSAAEYATVLSSIGRVRQQAQALLDGGWACFRRVRRLQHLITELAFCKSKVRLADRFHTDDEIAHLRREIAALRDRLSADRIAWRES